MTLSENLSVIFDRIVRFSSKRKHGRSLKKKDKVFRVKRVRSLSCVNVLTNRFYSKEKSLQQIVWTGALYHSAAGQSW